VLDDRQLADLAFQGLLPHLKDRYASQEFESLGHLVHRISDQDTRVFEPKKNWSKKVSFVDEVEDSDSDEEPVIGLTEWVKNKRLISCPFGQKEPEKFTFDITKADKIFDLFLQEGQIKLSPNHVIPSTEELKKIQYCKWHMQLHIVQMSARCSGSSCNRPSNMGELSLATPRPRSR
jgi:hypothetical protein